MDSSAHDCLGILAEVRDDAAGTAIAWEMGELPDVQADAVLLRKVWANLIDNAVKFSSRVAVIDEVLAGGA